MEVTPPPPVLAYSPRLYSNLIAAAQNLSRKWIGGIEIGLPDGMGLDSRVKFPPELHQFNLHLKGVRHPFKDDGYVHITVFTIGPFGIGSENENLLDAGHASLQEVGVLDDDVRSASLIHVLNPLISAIHFSAKARVHFW